MPRPDEQPLASRERGSATAAPRNERAFDARGQYAGADQDGQYERAARDALAPAGEISPALGDEQVAELIRERLREDPGIAADGITVTVAAGQVVLEGVVSNVETRDLVEHVAEQFGVHGVRNNLGVPGADGSDTPKRN
jgi:osmotically-inducible protein OsmY